MSHPHQRSPQRPQSAQRIFRAAFRVFLTAPAIALAMDAFVGPTVFAQETSPGLVRKGRVPVSNDILKIKLPRPAEANLSNGLHLIVLEDHRRPEISFQLIIPGAGGFFDPAEQPGLASFTASLMREGTATRTSNQISSQLDLMAATLIVTAAATSTEATLNGSALSDQVSTLFDLAADVLLH